MVNVDFYEKVNVGKIAKKTVWRSAFFFHSATQNAVPCSQKYTPTDCYLAILPTGWGFDLSGSYYNVKSNRLNICIWI